MIENNIDTGDLVKHIPSQAELVDSYFRFVDDGESNDSALTNVCFKYQLSSYDEEVLKQLVK